MAVTTASYPPPALTLSPRYVNCLTVSTSSRNFSSGSTASPIFPSHFLQVKFLFNSGVTIFTHLPCIHPPHCTHNTELTFALKLLTQHESALLFDKPSCVKPLLTITLVFPRLSFKPLLSKASFHFENLSRVPWMSHSSGLCHQQAITNLAHPLWQIQWQHLPPLQKKRWQHWSLVNPHFDLKFL